MFPPIFPVSTQPYRYYNIIDDIPYAVVLYILVTI